ncbi:DUF2865 domain-containing protein [Bradyrhizobium sp. AUGA SZCCT0169]|uniref:DUF2865 domain-containing protein n=1 Tax=Bradyrhizobium sp. AUGA SZCCT0169 TaxID=2807663 RepID=UPI001BA63278|nr:DUF2865 domain-containing protein [Bradyrhizobium sp. AUGA SZCCT0169]MBR1250901.1 DUF2865 domain-containing protein [Bradyrhizobium sp. AUGA SZCCT0169]
MPLTLTAPFSRWILTCAVLLAGIAGTSSAAIAQADPAPSNMDALAQMPPGAAPPPQQQGAQANPICIRLEGQLAAVDRGASGGDPAKEEQIRRYQEAATKQQAELDRVTMQAKRMGCESSGFFSLFNGQSAQCGPVNNQIQQMRANLEQMTTSLERLRSGGIGGADRENQRRSVLTALAQNNCGPQYAAAARNGGSFIDNLFGNNTIPPPSADLGAPSGTFRTVCVRTCDGAYFPVSFATYQARFQDDERTCKALCPATEASLFTYRNPGEDINQAVSVSGQPYSSLPNAFKFRTEFNPSCACKAAGQTWSDALKSIDEKAAAEQQGDIIVTEESAKRMQQRAMPQQKTAPVAKKGTAPAGTTAAAPAPAAPETTAPAPNSTGATDEKKPIRTVGPTFIPPKQ